MTSPTRIKTNHLLAKAFDLNDFLDPTRFSHDELQYYNDLTRAIDKTIDRYVDWLGTPEAQELFYENAKYSKDFFESIDSELDEVINDTSLSADKIVEKIYNKGLTQGYKDIRRRFVFNDACKYGLKATQEYNFELITNVSDDLRDSIRHDIFRGVAEGQSIHEVARAITDRGLQPLEGKTLSAYQRATLIARTEIARSMSAGRLQAYANYGVEKVKILTAGDDDVCPICREAETKIYTIEEASGLIPFHPCCRCSIIAYIEHYQDIPQEPKIDSEVIDCTVNNNLNTSGKPVTDCKFTDRKESRKIAKELGFEYVPLRHGDEKFIYKVQIGNQYKEIELRFSGELLKALDNGEHEDIYYSKKEILRVFKNSPDWLKIAPKNINFINSYQSKYPNATGYHKRGNCYITPLAFKTSQSSHANLPFTLYHEMAHAFDWRMSKLVDGHGLSNESEEYFKHIVKDNIYIRQERDETFLYPSDHAFDTDEHHEDFAESLAMVALGRSVDKKYAIITMSNGETVHYHDWKIIFSNRNSYFQEYLSNDTKEIINNFRKKIELSKI